MFPATNRRRFITQAATGSTLLGLGDLGFLTRLRPLSAAEVNLNPNLVQCHPEIEPLVRLLETTPRERLLEEVAARIQKGLTYREVLAALLLAGVRNVPPRPSVGFKFHAVLVVNSAHLASLASPDKERWLPIFWALDYFKSQQMVSEKESAWKLAPVNESRVPPARKARQAFLTAMESWDEEAADAAVAGLVRTAGAAEIVELFWRLGARDFRSIGHKAIYVANSWRTLQVIGWHHAEPVLRSLTFALLNHQGEPNPAKSDLAADRAGRRNQGLAAKIGKAWQEGKPSTEATAELLATLRTASDEAACQNVVELLNRGVAVQSIWDSLLTGAGELLMRQPGIVALHAMTTTNALRHAYETTASDETRRWLLLQNAAFLPLFREAMRGRGAVKDVAVDQLEPLPLRAEGPAAVEEIFSDLGRDKVTAARKALAFLQTRPQPQPLLDAARVLVFLKGTDSHDYKFSSAVLEDWAYVSPAWRDRYLAASMFWLRSSADRDNRLVERTRVALKA